MTDPYGVNLLPASGEWVYDPLPHRAAHAGEAAPTIVNLNAAPGGTRTDYSIAIDQLQAQHPGCRTVSLVVAWFGDSVDAAQCRIYPATNYPGGASDVLVDGAWRSEPWRCSGLTQTSPGLLPISRSGDGATYGGTPSDPSVVRCIQDLKARGLRVTFYPFVLMDAPGLPWRGRITHAGDMAPAATDAVAAFLGPASPAQFSRDAANLTVGYTGAATDYTYRRMVLHYANLCVLAGGVDLFLLGSELRGLECLRGPAWTKAGAIASNGTTSWDYPMVEGLGALADDVRGVFDAASLRKDVTGLKNLIAYSADWSNWMGVQHSDAAGQWPHLDQLYARPSIDLVAFDNYLPLSDWTSDGGLDAQNWRAPAGTDWPPPPASVNGLGLAGPPMLANKAYLKANIEGGEKFAWFYANSDNLGRGADPAGSCQQVSRPTGDRLTQTRSPYAANQQALANKQVRWWWNNPHRAIYDAGDGAGWAPHGAPTRWVAQSKSITFAEYGFPSCDRCTNQPNVFYDPKSSESFTPFWSVWDGTAGSGFRPRRDDTLAALARDAIVEYWTTDGHNARSPLGVKMIEPTFMAAWNWDARPFPDFPALGLWGDGPNWATGTWIGGKGPGVAPATPDAPPSPGPLPPFPTLRGLGWSTTYRPVFVTDVATHVAGRESRAGRTAKPRWDIAMSFDVLDDVSDDIAALSAFYAARAGDALPFTVAVPSALNVGPTLTCRFADAQTDLEEFTRTLVAVRTLRLHSVEA